MNYWAYMMGTDIAEPDVLVVDDADFFENFLVSYHSVIVSRTEDKDLWELLMNDLGSRRIYQAKIETFRLGDATEEVQLVYFNHSIEIARKLRALVVAGKRNVSDELSFAVDRNKNALETYLMLVTRDSIVFTPLITSGLMHDRLKNIRKILFMSATIGSKDYIHRTLGSDEDLKILTERDVKSQIGTMGKRIIFPLDGIAPSPRLEDEALRATAKLCEAFGKAIVICCSHRDAHKVEEALQTKGLATTIYKKEADIASFSKGSSGVLITAGRYIGIDLPDEACRVAVIPKMPFVLGPTDALAKNLLNEKDRVKEKVGHRLVQAFGRCNRGPGDYAVYFVLDSRLANDNQAEGEICNFFHRRMRAELDYGQDYAEIGGLDKCIEVSKLLLGVKLPGFDAEIAKRLKSVQVPEANGKARPYKSDIRAWHDLAVRQNYLEAANGFSDSIQFHEKEGQGDEEVETQLAWLNYLAANCYYLAFLNYGNQTHKDRAIQHLKEAVGKGKTSWFSGLQLVINELGEKMDRGSSRVRHRNSGLR